MHKIIDIENFVRRSLSERDRRTLLFTVKFMKVTLQMVCCMRLHLMLSAKALGMLVKSAHKIGKKR